MPTGSPPPGTHPSEGEQSDSALAVAGIVLAGGSSRRMGTDKALLVVDGETLLGRAARRLEQAGASTVVVACGTPDRYAGHTSLVQVPDPPAHRGDGPLAGLAAAFAHLAPTHRIAIVLAVDLPDADPVLLAAVAAEVAGGADGGWPPFAGRTVADGFAADAPPELPIAASRAHARTGPPPAAAVPLDETGRAQPLHAAYDLARTLPVLTSALERGERRVLKVVLDELHARTVPGPPGTWSRNLNEPE